MENFNWINETTTAEEVLDMILADTPGEDNRRYAIAAIEIYGKFKHRQADAGGGKNHEAMTEEQKNLVWTAIDKLSEAEAALDKLEAPYPRVISTANQMIHEIWHDLRLEVFKPAPADKNQQQ